MNVLLENDRIIAVDKPAGILVIPDQYTDAKDTLLGQVETCAKQKIWVVHRIDRGTTGVVLFARDADTHSFLCRQFEEGEVEKRYVALVSGVIENDSGEINKPISVQARKIEISAEGKESLTRYRVIERFREFTLVEAEPQTGRRHQIRIHFWSIGHPLAIDPEYAHREALYLSQFKKNYKSKGDAEKPLMPRLSLHAARITFTEPSGERLTIEAPLPRDFQVTLKQLRKYGR